jgi:hypothetical protein
MATKNFFTCIFVTFLRVGQNFESGSNRVPPGYGHGPQSLAACNHGFWHKREIKLSLPSRIENLHHLPLLIRIKNLIKNSKQQY